LFASEIAKIIYAPQKTIRRIAEDPKYIGIIVIIALFIVANIGLSYAFATKVYLEQTVPNGSIADEWTANSTLWTSNAQITESDDYINGSYLGFTYYGNASLQLTIANSSQVWMQLGNIGPINCSGPDGYSKLSLRIKLVEPQIAPENATVRLSSTSPSDYFLYDISNNVSSFNIWNNLTILLNSEAWSRIGAAPDWQNITGLRLDFEWLQSSNITLRVDGLFFHGPFESLINTVGTTSLFNTAISAFIQFVITWVVLAGLLYIMVRAFGGKPVWKPLLIVVGFILVPMILQVVVFAVGYAALPIRHYPFELLGGVDAEGAAANNTILEQTFLVAQLETYMQIVTFIWSVALCSLAVHLLYEFKWIKSIPIGVIAYFISIYAVRFILGF